MEHTLHGEVCHQAAPEKKIDEMQDRWVQKKLIEDIEAQDNGM